MWHLSKTKSYVYLFMVLLSLHTQPWFCKWETKQNGSEWATPVATAKSMEGEFCTRA